jgi:ABC-2 type transport system permease protein
MSVLWALALHDVRAWLRSPVMLGLSLLPALGMGVLVAILSISIGRQPVAIVQEGKGPIADHMAHLLEADDEAYLVTRLDRGAAIRALEELRVAAVLVIPEDFDDRIAQADAHVELRLDNVVDVDLADDIRRAVTRSLAELDAPQLGIVGELHGPSEGLLLPNPFRVAIAEHDRRDTNVEFFEYEIVPILVLVILGVGVLGTGLLAARDIERGTMKQTLLAPVDSWVVIASKLLGGTLATILILVPVCGIALALGWLRAPPGHWPPFLALLLALVVLAVGLGLALGVWIRRPRLVAMAGLNVSAYLFFLGGGFATVAFLPPWLERTSRFVPTSYAISALRQILFYPDLDGVMMNLTMVTASALLCVAAGIVALRRSWGARA